MKAPIGGGTATTLVAAEGPLAVVADETSVYWVNDSGTLMKVVLEGNVVSTLISAGVAHLGGEYGTHALAVELDERLRGDRNRRHVSAGHRNERVTPK